MKINEFDNQLSQGDLDSLETFADKVFGKVGIDVNFTRHFLDRVNDERNVKQISMGELTRLFKQEAKRWAKPIAQLGPDSEAVMKDLQTDLNLPFILVWDERNEELDLIAKTVMRKKNFKTSDQEFTIENIDEAMLIQIAESNDMGNLIVLDEDGKLVNREELLENPAVLAVISGLAKAGQLAYKYGKPIVNKIGSKVKNYLSGARPDAIGSGVKIKSHPPFSRVSKQTHGPGTSRGRTYNPGAKPQEHTSGTIYLKPGVKRPTAKRTNSRHDMKEESTISTMNKENPNNPEIHIQGYGVVTLSGLEKSIVRMIKELGNMADQGNFGNVNHSINKGLLQTKLQAVLDTKEQLQSIRKKGGRNSKGIAKESINEEPDLTLGQLVTDLKGHEKFSPKPYDDFKQKSIGYGRKATPGETSTTKKAELTKLVKRAQRELTAVRKTYPNLTPEQQRAVSSLRYNVGPAGLSNSKAHKALKVGNKDEFKHQAFDSEIGFVNAGGEKNTGLQNRRAKERKLFNTPGIHSQMNPNTLTRESLFDTLIGETREMDPESPFDMLAIKYATTLHKRAYERSAERLHSVLQRKYKENDGKWRHALQWYVSKIAEGFTNVKSAVLMQYYLKNYESAFIVESGGVGKIVPGINTTVDVGPDEIKKQAKKFGNDVDKNGVPKNTHRK